MKIPEDHIETTCFYTWLGEDGICRTKAKDGAVVTIEEAQENSEAVLAFDKGHKYPLVVEMSRMKSITKEARDFYSLQNRKSPINAIGLITNSPVSRVIGNFFIGLNKSRVPNKLFTSEESALIWLTQYILDES